MNVPFSFLFIKLMDVLYFSFLFIPLILLCSLLFEQEPLFALW